MPLKHGKSEAAFKENVRTEMHAGKPQKQALAIAYSVKRRAKKMAHGGEADDDEGIRGSLDPNYYVKGVHKPFAGEGKSQMGSAARGHWSYGDAERNSAKAKKEHEKVSGEAAAIKPKLMAHGGEMKQTHECIGHGCEHDSHMPPAHMEAEMADDLGGPDDMVGQIVRKHFSEGGRVANEDSGESASVPDQMAKDEPNEFDDLALDDDLSSEYTGANSGDELGDGRLDHDEADIIARVMRSRAKKDRMPRPA